MTFIGIEWQRHAKKIMGRSLKTCWM